MKHRKKKNVQHVRICQYYVKDICEFDSEDYWYRHDASSPQTISDFQCTLCEKALST